MFNASKMLTHHGSQNDTKENKKGRRENDVNAKWNNISYVVRSAYVFSTYYVCICILNISVVTKRRDSSLFFVS